MPLLWRRPWDDHGKRRLDRLGHADGRRGCRCRRGSRCGGVMGHRCGRGHGTAAEDVVGGGESGGPWLRGTAVGVVASNGGRGRWMGCCCGRCHGSACKRLRGNFCSAGTCPRSLCASVDAHALVQLSWNLNVPNGFGHARVTIYPLLAC